MVDFLHKLYNIQLFINISYAFRILFNNKYIGDLPQKDTMKEQITQLRKKIDRIDRTLIDCLDKRIEIARIIGDIKKKNNLPIFNKAREKKILSKVELALNKKIVIPIFKEILRQSRKAQGEKCKLE